MWLEAFFPFPTIHHNTLFLQIVSLTQFFLYVQCIFFFYLTDNFFGNIFTVFMLLALENLFEWYLILLMSSTFDVSFSFQSYFFCSCMLAGFDSSFPSFLYSIFTASILTFKDYNSLHHTFSSWLSLSMFLTFQKACVCYLPWLLLFSWLFLQYHHLYP